jgi:hypothetical protein
MFGIRWSSPVSEILLIWDQQFAGFAGRSAVEDRSFRIVLHSILLFTPSTPPREFNECRARKICAERDLVVSNSCATRPEKPRNSAHLLIGTTIADMAAAELRRQVTVPSRAANCNRNTNDIMKLNRSLFVAGISALLSLGANTNSLAQQDNAGPPPGRGNFDPSQFRQRMMDRLKEQLEVTDDAEWKALEPMIQAVMDARMSSMSGMGRGMFGGPRRGGNNNNNNSGDQPRRGNFGQPSSPEADALQKAIDAKAPKAEIKTALEKYVAARKTKQAQLEKAQDDLRKVLTTRQEAIATLNGLL